MAEDRVLAVEPGRILVGDKELAAVAAGSGVGHGEDAGAAVLEVRPALVLETVAGAAGAGTLRTAALNHEVRDDAMEGEPVVERLVLLLRRASVPRVILGALSQADKIGHG